ncbi:MAG TPA: hypothetical protein VLV18_07640 [Terriglobales bacterium]|nr:hypothetical protein [Terriglobales bacterium]
MPSNTSLKGTSTTTRAIRISKSVDRILESEARKRNISINGLISSVLTKFAEWDRYAEDLHLTTLPTHIVKKLTELMSEDLIAKAGAELGPELLTSEVIFWYEKVTLQTFLEWLTLVSKYNGLISTQITKTDGDYVIVARHDLGKKCSLFLKNYFESGLKARMGIAPEIEMSEFQVSFRLRNVST